MAERSAASLAHQAPDWDADSPQLRSNLRQVLHGIRADMLARQRPTLAWARKWHAGCMAGLQVPKPAHVGRFRGEPGLKTCRVDVQGMPGTAPAKLAAELKRYEQRLRRAVAALDARYPSNETLDEDGLAATIDLAAWAHAEWVRMHPFANGNGRTARLWANGLLMRYGLPPVPRLRPRPDGAYAAAGRAAMAGTTANNWQATALLLLGLMQRG